MKNQYIRRLEGYAAFKEECSFYRCADEYPGWTGTERYIVCAALSQEELERKYPAIMRHLSPFILIYTDGSDPLADFKRNEDKFRWRAVHMENACGLDDLTECCHTTPVTADIEEDFIWQETLASVMGQLSEAQQRRVKQRLIDGMTYAEIAKSEATSIAAIRKSVELSVEKLKKYFDGGFKNGRSHS